MLACDGTSVLRAGGHAVRHVPERLARPSCTAGPVLRGDLDGGEHPEVLLAHTLVVLSAQRDRIGAPCAVLDTAGRSLRSRALLGRPPALDSAEPTGLDTRRGNRITQASRRQRKKTVPPNCRSWSPTARVPSRAPGGRRWGRRCARRPRPGCIPALGDLHASAAVVGVSITPTCCGRSGGSRPARVLRAVPRRARRRG